MKTRVLGCALAAILLMVFASGCVGGEYVTASKNYITKEMKMDNFHAVNLQGSGNVAYRQGDEPRVEIYGSDNVVEKLDVFVEGGTLYLKYKKGVRVRGDSKLSYRVYSPELNGLSINGAGNVMFANGVNSQGDLSVTINGSGNIKGEAMRCRDLSVKINGSGRVDLKGIESASCSFAINGSGDLRLGGTSGTIDMRISGAGNIRADELKAGSVSVGISGSGDVKCYATEKLKARISGAGNIGYKGDPKEIDVPRKGVRKL
ncbi:MAG: DUF2807 domain-containing protein [Mediterranea sp.]|jgi:hypothetical protein|nr:DUF2807 domain-containing protein [Mediterranea sp.]